MARPRTPTKVLKLRGAFEKDPKRGKARENEPPPGGPLGPPPKEFDEAHQARWNEITEWCPWLEASHRFQVEAVCRLIVRMRNEFKSADVGILTAALSKLGMNPVDRSKVQMPRAEEKKKSLLA